jgi:hypothetical protein
METPEGKDFCIVRRERSFHALRRRAVVEFEKGSYQGMPSGMPYDYTVQSRL